MRLAIHARRPEQSGLGHQLPCCLPALEGAGTSCCLPPHTDLPGALRVVRPLEDPHTRAECRGRSLGPFLKFVPLSRKQESLFIVRFDSFPPRSCLIQVWGKTVEGGQAPFACRQRLPRDSPQRETSQWGSRESGWGPRPPLLKRRKKRCQKGQQQVALDQLTDFLGDHFLSGCRERREERQPPQLAVLFRLEAAQLTPGSPVFHTAVPGQSTGFLVPSAPGKFRAAVPLSAQHTAGHKAVTVSVE